MQVQDYKLCQHGAQGAASAGSRASSFCMTLVLQPPPGAWQAPDQGAPPPRICWAVPSGPEPATSPEIRAARVLWIVGVGTAPAADQEAGPAGKHCAG